MSLATCRAPRQGEGTLFTLDTSVQPARRCPGGCFANGCRSFNSETELQIILRTFLTVFPHTSLWRGFSPDQPAMALTGSPRSFELRPSDIERRVRE
jgi:hypothetical protein